MCIVCVCVFVSMYYYYRIVAATVPNSSTIFISIYYDMIRLFGSLMYHYHKY